MKTSPGNEGVIYSICWAPADLNCLLAGTSKKGMFVWNFTTNRITQRFHEVRICKTLYLQIFLNFYMITKFLQLYFGKDLLLYVCFTQFLIFTITSMTEPSEI